MPKPLRLTEGTEDNDPILFGDGDWTARPYFFRVGPFRVPEAGEWYISGAKPQAYRARNRLGVPYRILVPTHHAVRDEVYRRGEPVNPLTFR